MGVWETRQRGTVVPGMVQLEVLLCVMDKEGEFMMESGKRFLADESGIGVVEVILILLVLVGLVLIFKDQIVALAQSIFSNISSQAGSV